jgi:hypothetical protein
VKLGSRVALENLRMHRQKLAVDPKGRAGYDVNLPVGQIDQEMAVIEAGPERLNGRSQHRPRHQGSFLKR